MFLFNFIRSKFLLAGNLFNIYYTYSQKTNETELKVWKQTQVYRANLAREPIRLSGRKTVSSTNGSEKLDIYMQKNETGPLPYNTCKNLLKIEERYKCKA